MAQQKMEVVATISSGVNSLIDGDNTEALLNMINLANDNEIHDALINVSPYLSDEILLALIQKDPKMDESIFVDILLANCGLSDTVITALIDYELTSANRELVNASINNLSERSKLYMELNNALFEHNLARMDVINYGLDNVSESNNLEVLDELELDNSLSGKYRQLDWMMQCGIYDDDKEALLRNIANLEGDAKSYRYQMAEVNLALLDENKLTYSQYSELDLLIDSMPYSTIPSQSLLKYYSGKSFERAPFVSEEAPMRKAKPNVNVENKTIKLSIIPNPANNQTTIDFGKEVSGIVTIYAVDGQIINQINIFSSDNQIISLNSMSKGVYIVSFVDGFNGSSFFGKLIIQ
jgi:hypothetical protein